MPSDSPVLAEEQLGVSLTREPERFSDDAWELLLAAQDTARRWRHGAMDVEHLLQALLLERRFGNWVGRLPIDVDRVLDGLESFCLEQPGGQGPELYVGDALEDLLEQADRCRAAWGSRLIDLPHLLLALLDEPRLGASLLAAEGLGEEQLLRCLRPGVPEPRSERPALVAPAPAAADAWIDTPAAASPGPAQAPAPRPAPARGADSEPAAGELRLEAEASEPTALERYGRDLTAAARAGELDPVIGRDAEIRRLMQVLSRRSKNNPVLLGEPGVGKTAVVELLAQRIVAAEVPEALLGQRLVALDLGALIAGAKFRGQFEERLRAVLAEVRDADPGVILFIDELHTVVSSDRSSADAGSILKPALARGELRCIGATTSEEYRRSIAKDPALERRFQQQVVREPDLETSVAILRGLKER
ncbi:MAG: AAA family ATPase, partial [Prochlorococcaceae cyanobacterium]